MQVLTSLQMQEADKFTIEHTPISSIDLMERASAKCFDWFSENIDNEYSIHVFCGPGNNGGDGLALSRMLNNAGYRVKAHLLRLSNTLSPDCLTNLERLKLIDIKLVAEFATTPESFRFPDKTIIVDALFGTGLTRNVEGEAAKLVRILNDSGHQIISIDMPSGIYSDRTSLITGNEIIKARKTLTFQYMKTALLIPENAPYFGNVEVLDIGLHPEALHGITIKSHLVDHKIIQSIFKPRPDFSHKGTFGHGLLVCGGSGKMGAAILAGNAFLRSGAGLLTILIPDNAAPIIHTTVPEAMVQVRPENEEFIDTEPYKTIGIGPGLGTGNDAQKLLDKLLNFKIPMVLDADALNILSLNPKWIDRIPENSILTPHPGEFIRLCGEWKNDFDKLEMQQRLAIDKKLYIVLKGKNTSIACPDGTIYFNPTGNSGMAKGGSGDVLTGLITGLLTSGYNSFEASILGVYLHGLAGDLASHELTCEGMTAGDIVRFIPNAWREIKDQY